MARNETGERGGVSSFATRLKAIREAAGLTQAQLAEKSGLHLGAIFKLEQGRREPSWATVQALADALGVSCEAFRETGGVNDEAQASRAATPKRLSARQSMPVAETEDLPPSQCKPQGRKARRARGG